jgi:PAS domain S-box-containing protein
MNATDPKNNQIVGDSYEQQQQENLRQAKELSDAILELTGAAVVVLDPLGRIVRFNQTAQEVTGYSFAELRDQPIWDWLIPPERLDDVKGVFNNLMFDRWGGYFENEWLTKDGGRRLFAFRNKALHDATGEVSYVIAVGEDITERRKAETALVDRETQLRFVLEGSDLGFWDWDIVTGGVDRNERWATMLGYTHNEIKYTTQQWTDFIHPDDRARAWESISAVLEGRSDQHKIEYRMLHKDGSIRWILDQARVMQRDADGNPTRMCGTHTDITERKAAEQALRQSEQRLRWALEGASGGAWDWDLMRGEAWWSPEMYELWGVEPGTPMLLANSLAQVHEHDRERVATTVEASVAGHTDYQIEFRIRHPVRGERWMASRGRAIYDASGHPLRMLGITLDITERKQIEEQLREADQRKDEFLAMLAHELRNPLTPIRNAASLLAEPNLPKTRLSWASDLIENQVAHLSRLVDDLLDISRIARGKITLRKERLDLAELLRQAHESVEPDMTAKAHRFEIHLPAESVSLQGDRVRLVQVFQNLLGNAVKFTPEGGHIVLSARATENEVEIEVVDNGVGIAPDLLPGVFDLFRQGESTLDRSRGGLGIGLTLVRRLVEMHGGRVEARSPGPGQGAAISVYLPRAGEIDESPIPVEPSPRAATRLRVLVVDDDPAVADSTVVFLESKGYEVRSAGTGEAALNIVKTFRPEVVLLDIGLPGQDGYTVAMRMRELPEGRDIVLVAVSGYGHQEAVTRSMGAGFDRHLVKPVGPKALNALLAEVGAKRDYPPALLG